MFYVFALFSLLSLQALPARAQTTSAPDVVISEINWAGSALSQADEWIELYNADSQSVDLGGWILTGSASSGEALALEEGVTLAPGQTLLIANYDLGNEKSTLTVSPDLVTASLSLSNSQQEIVLAMIDGTVVDSVGDGGIPQAGSTDPIAAMERNMTDRTWQSASASRNMTDATQLGTPGVAPAASPVTSLQEQSDVNEEASPPSVEEVNLPEVSSDTSNVSLTPDQLASCYALYMPTDVRMPEADPIEEAVDNTATDVEDEGEEEVPAEMHIPTEPDPVPEEYEKTPEPIVTAMSYAPGVLIINELVSDPNEGEEWVELFNASNDDVDTTGWTLQEGSGKTTPLTDEVLSAGAYLVIESIKGNLNNAGDSLTLTDAADHVIDSMSYGDEPAAPNKGESLGRTHDGAWSVTDTPTPGKSNQFNEVIEDPYAQAARTEPSNSGDDSEDEYEDVSDTEQDSTSKDSVVSDASKIHTVVALAQSPEEEESGSQQHVTATSSTVTVEGTVTAIPGTFGSQIAFIDGMQLYFYHAEWPELALGDVIQVSGEPSIAWEESRLKIAESQDITVIAQQELAPTPLEITDVFSQDIGSLVQINGDIVAVDGTSLTLRDDSGEIEIIANERIDMSWSDLSSSSYTITGVVRTRNGEWQLYVRDWADVEATASQAPNSDAQQDDLTSLTSDTDSNTPWIGAIIFGASVSSVVYWIVRFKFQPSFTQQVTS